MATKKNSVPIRVDGELADLLQEIKDKNDITKVQASRELARQVIEMRREGKVIRREIKFG